jgi:hypothetical protein
MLSAEEDNAMSRALRRPTTRLEPSSGLGREGARIFRSVTKAMPAAHFTEADRGALESLVSATLRHRAAARHIDHDDPTDPWWRVLRESSEVMARMRRSLSVAPTNQRSRREVGYKAEHAAAETDLTMEQLMSPDRWRADFRKHKDEPPGWRERFPELVGRGRRESQ